MIEGKQEWNEYIFNMHRHATAEFRCTDHYRALKEKLVRMEGDCRGDSVAKDFFFMEKWIEALMEVNAAECGFMYERGYQDCVALLRRLEVV